MHSISVIRTYRLPMKTHVGRNIAHMTAFAKLMTSSSCRKCWGPFGSHYKVTRAVCCLYHVARGYCEPSIAAACAGRVRRGFDALPSAPPRCRLVRWVGLRRIRHAVARVASLPPRVGPPRFRQ
eukprot:5500799-Pyramimonas_sp.AAC.1